MKRKYYQPFSLRISEEMHHKLRGIADAHKRSENNEIGFWEEYIKQYEVKHGVIPKAPIAGNLK